MLNTTTNVGLYQQPLGPLIPRKGKPKTPTRKETPNEKAARKRKEKRVETVYVPPPPITEEEKDFRHAHWKEKRRRVIEALANSNIGPSSLENFINCGSDCVVKYSNEEKRFVLAANHCHSRHCEPCMKAKAMTMAANLQKIVADHPGKQFRFITLTLKHTHEPLSQQLDRLTECFRKLRQSKTWKDTQDGGASMIEVKYNPDTGEWHPHLHIVAEGYYLHHTDLSNQWLNITGDSFRVDIRPIKSARDAAFYVAKYISKGVNDPVWLIPHVSKEWIEALKGRRMCATYGTWRGHKLLEKQKPPTDLRYICRMEELVRAANRNETWAVTMLDAIKRDLQYNPNKQRAKKGSPLPVAET